MKIETITTFTFNTKEVSEPMDRYSRTVFDNITASTK